MKNILLSTVMALFLLPIAVGAQETNTSPSSASPPQESATPQPSGAPAEKQDLSQPSARPPAHLSPADQQTVRNLLKDNDKIYTQREINDYYCYEARKAQREMDDVFKQVETRYNYDKVFAGYLKKAQDAWVAYRDAQVLAIYPAEYRQNYGSMAKYCDCNARTEMTKERTAALKKWLTGKMSGGCTGTQTGGDKSKGAKVMNVEQSK